nr:unnamed protein product [Digitaria exilis]
MARRGGPVSRIWRGARRNGGNDRKTPAGTRRRTRGSSKVGSRRGGRKGVDDAARGGAHVEFTRAGESVTPFHPLRKKRSGDHEKGGGREATNPSRDTKRGEENQRDCRDDEAEAEAAGGRSARAGRPLPSFSGLRSGRRAGGRRRSARRPERREGNYENDVRVDGRDATADCRRSPFRSGPGRTHGTATVVGVWLLLVPVIPSDGSQRLQLLPLLSVRVKSRVTENDVFFPDPPQRYGDQEQQLSYSHGG